MYMGNGNIGDRTLRNHHIPQASSYIIYEPVVRDGLLPFRYCMYLRSPYPDVPLTTETNVQHLFFHRPDQAEWKDYTLHIDAKTGKKRTFHEFLDRVRCGMAALGAPQAEGGLGFGTWEVGEMIGIMSQNSMVTRFLS
jgi:hypothetical protein